MLSHFIRAASGYGADPYFSNVTLLLHFDGADTSTTFTDSSKDNRTVSVVGGTQIDTAQSKFGGSSGWFPGSNDYLTVSNTSQAVFGCADGDWTVEFWVRRDIGSKDEKIVTTESGSSGVNFACGSGNKAYLYDENSGGFCTSTSTMSADTWYHLAWDYDGTSTRVYFNGTHEATNSSITYQNGNSTLYIGCDTDGTTKELTGWIEDLRITKGVARYAGTDFDVPTGPYPNK